LFQGVAESGCLRRMMSVPFKAGLIASLFVVAARGLFPQLLCPLLRIVHRLLTLAVALGNESIYVPIRPSTGSLVFVRILYLRCFSFWR
jgi:hypothetical protein